MNPIGYLSGEGAYCPDCFSASLALVTAITRDTTTDTPTHCVQCEVLIPHALTEDGLQYVANAIDSHIRSKLDGHRAGRVCILATWWEEYHEQFFADKWHDELLALMMDDYFNSMPSVDEHSPPMARMLAQVNGVYPHRWVVIDETRKVAKGPFVNLNMAGAVGGTLVDAGHRPITFPLEEVGDHNA